MKIAWMVRFKLVTLILLLNWIECGRNSFGNELNRSTTRSSGQSPWGPNLPSQVHHSRNSEVSQFRNQAGYLYGFFCSSLLLYSIQHGLKCSGCAFCFVWRLRLLLLTAPSVLYFLPSTDAMTLWSYEQHYISSLSRNSIIWGVLLSWRSLSAFTIIQLLQTQFKLSYWTHEIQHLKAARMTTLFSLQEHGYVSYLFLWDRLEELNLLCPGPNGGGCLVAHHRSFVGLVQEFFSKGILSLRRGWYWNIFG